MMVLRFSLAKQWYGLPIERVVEVLRLVGWTELPDMPPHMLGMINYRGVVMPLLDLRLAMEQPATRLTLDTPLLVTRSEQDVYTALIVDEVIDVADLKLEDETHPNALITTLARTDERLLLMVDLDAVVDLHHTVETR